MITYIYIQNTDSESCIDVVVILSVAMGLHNDNIRI